VFLERDGFNSVELFEHSDSGLIPERLETAGPPEAEHAAAPRILKTVLRTGSVGPSSYSRLQTFAVNSAQIWGTARILRDQARRQIWLEFVRAIRESNKHVGDTAVRYINVSSQRLRPLGGILKMLVALLRIPNCHWLSDINVTTYI